MTRRGNSVNVIKGMCHVQANAGAAITGNTGMFATATRIGAGDYDITIDPEFPIDTRDTVRVLTEGVTALATFVTRVGVLDITCGFENMAGAPTDPSTFFAIVVEGPSIG